MIGVNCSERKMRILAAILKTDLFSTQGTQFDEIYEQLLREETGTKISKPLVYRCITALENEGYIKCDRSGYRHYYKTSLDQIANAISRRLQNIVEEKRATVTILKSELSRLEHAINGSVTELLDDIINRRCSTKRTRFVTGIKGVRRLFESDLCPEIKDGDVIRISLDWTTKSIDGIKDLIAIVCELLEKGTIIRVLLPADTLQNYELHQSLIQLHDTTDFPSTELVVKKRTHASLTYQTVVRNRQSMILVIGTNPTRAVYLHREAHPTLLDDAVVRFDEEFARGTPIDFRR